MQMWTSLSGTLRSDHCQLVIAVCQLVIQRSPIALPFVFCSCLIISRQAGSFRRVGCVHVFARGGQRRNLLGVPELAARERGCVRPKQGTATFTNQVLSVDPHLGSEKGSLWRECCSVQCVQTPPHNPDQSTQAWIGPTKTPCVPVCANFETLNHRRTQTEGGHTTHAAVIITSARKLDCRR